MRGALTAERGATLLEVVVAILLLAIGALALAGSITQALRARELSVSTALAAVAAEAWIERWRGQAVSGEGWGSTGVAWGGRRGRLEWTLVEVASCLQEARVAVVAGRREAVRVEVATRRFREGASGC